MAPGIFVLEVWGELACFSRPELKVERFSYPVITPSAARGIFDAIYCKPPEFRWQIVRVELLAPPRYIALRRNEVKEKASLRAIDAWRRGKAEPVPIFADVSGKDFWGDDTRGRTQRQTMALKDVRYRLHARIVAWPGFEGRRPAFEAQFRRRAVAGKCIYQPYFGCREFPAYFELVEDNPPQPPPAPVDIPVGWMLYDVFDLSRLGTARDQPSISVFDAEVKAGVLTVPPYDSDAVRRATRRER